MFWLALGFLTLAAGVLHRVGEGFSTYFEFEVIAWALVLLWPVFVAEGVLRLVTCVRQEHLAWRVGYLLLIVLAPPLRIGGRSYADVGKMWLPGLGWCTVDRRLRKRLERFFSVPMMVIAFLVLPVLAMEYFWAEAVRAHFGLSLFLDIASSIIWMAFALEFILMVSIASRKWRYCVQNWMDAAIVALPLVDFMPLLRLLRLTRLLELKQLTRLGRLYRMRGLLLKLWRATLLLDILNRLTGNRKMRRLLQLRDLRQAKLEELSDLNEEIADLERQLERELAAAKIAAPDAVEPNAVGSDSVDTDSVELRSVESRSVEPASAANANDTALAGTTPASLPSSEPAKASAQT